MNPRFFCFPQKLILDNYLKKITNSAAINKMIFVSFYFVFVSHLSVLGGGGPLGGAPLEGSQDAWQHPAVALRGVVGELHGGGVVLRGAVVVLRGACLIEEALHGVQIQRPVPALGPGRLPLQQRRRRRQPAAPSVASPSSQHI